MRISTVRTLSVRVVGTMLPILLLTTPSAADLFFWDSQTTDEQWSDHLNWTGPVGQFPNGADDSATVSGASGWDPVLDLNTQLGALTLQNGGDACTGDGNNSNYGVIVTSVGGGSGLTLIKDRGSTLSVFSSSNSNDLDTDDLLIRDGAGLKLYDGAKIQVDDLLDLNPGAILLGEGSVEFTRDDGTHDPDNGGRIWAFGGTLRFFGHPDTVFDLDGAGEDGILEANYSSTLIFDLDVESIFNGTMTIGARAEIEINDTWALSSEPGTTLSFNGGTGDDTAILSGEGVTLFGDVFVNSGDARISAIASVGGAGGGVTLAAGTTLEFDTFLFVDEDATFQGAGELSISSGATLELQAGASVGVALRSDGLIIMAASGAGEVAVDTFEQGASGVCEFGICAPDTGGGSDLLTVAGTATLGGQLDVGLIQNCEPDPGDEFVIITAASVAGEFAEVTGFPNVQVVYDATSVTVLVTAACPADFDGDGVVDVTDLLQVLSGWDGPGGDIDGDGITDITDLLAVLEAWGPCS